MTEHNLPEKDDAPWLNLSPEEIEDLRKSKQKLTDEATRKIRELMRNQVPYPDEMFIEAERRERSNRVLQRYNHFYNEEVSGLPHGTTTTMEQLQAISLECMIDTFVSENANGNYNEIAIDDIKDLIERLYEQGKDYLEKVKTTWGPKE